MRPYSKDSINSLSELFQAWLGGYPEQDDEIRLFLKKTKLETILGVSNVDVILREEAYFPDIVLPAVYAVMPVAFELPQKEIKISLQELNKLNYQAMKHRDNTHCLSISFGAANNLQNAFGEAKILAIKNYPEQQKLKKELEEQRLRDEIEARKEARERRLQQEAELQQRRIENRERKLREKEEAQKAAAQRELNRKRNDVYRERHRLELRERAKQRRIVAKEQDPEGLKQLDKINNQKYDRKKICHDYYERHKEEICKKTNNTPKAALYKKQYKTKTRFKTNTGPKVLALLNGIINYKARS